MLKRFSSLCYVVTKSLRPWYANVAALINRSSVGFQLPREFRLHYSSTSIRLSVALDFAIRSRSFSSKDRLENRFNCNTCRSKEKNRKENSRAFLPPPPHYCNLWNHSHQVCIARWSKINISNKLHSGTKLILGGLQNEQQMDCC